MATKTFVGSVNGNWSNQGNWSPAGVPLSTDLPTLNASSPSVTIDTDAYCTGLNCTGYTHALTFNKSLTVLGGTITFGAAMSFAASGVNHGLTLAGGSIIFVTNSVPLTIPLYIGSIENSFGASITLNSADLTVTKNIKLYAPLSLNGSKNLVLNNSDGSGIQIAGGASTSITTVGTNVISVTGTNVSINASNMSVPITVNSAGTVSFSYICTLNNGITSDPLFTWIAGDISGSNIEFSGAEGQIDLGGTTVGSMNITNSLISIVSNFTTPFLSVDNCTINASSPVTATVANFAPGNATVVNPNVTLNVTTELDLALNCSLASTSPGTQVVLTLTPGALQSSISNPYYQYDNFSPGPAFSLSVSPQVATITDIDSHLGDTIYVAQGVLSNCINWVPVGGSETVSSTIN